MNQEEFDLTQEYYGLDSLTILARAILLDKVKFIKGRIVVEPFDDL